MKTIRIRKAIFVYLLQIWVGSNKLLTLIDVPPGNDPFEKKNITAMKGMLVLPDFPCASCPLSWNAIFTNPSWNKSYILLLIYMEKQKFIAYFAPDPQKFKLYERIHITINLFAYLIVNFCCIMIYLPISQNDHRNYPIFLFLKLQKDL